MKKEKKKRVCDERKIEEIQKKRFCKRLKKLYLQA
jgi:hypothetical protein